ncbi:hypothetical protein G4G28_01710 [Massilia sp. Dwa41.01b]|uniref:hypothetical protein n=1 Tax=unclassified Massilia TaxID=2609279 RepID=UPI0015FF0A9F|nr:MULTISPECIES: hypothetical protein [unclassified Massilia]QNA87495.1 hypothetical protein G4G28_01710 [Massilia sp. Dwa41.01b]QNA98402.1 hypothetical protein G4G31_05470 [Massilia sp. Se16.2.3]
MAITEFDLSGYGKQSGCPLVLPGFRLYAERDLVRMRGPFVQALLFAHTRSEWLDVVPVFYVAGANPADAALFQTMSVPLAGASEKRRWLFPADAPVEEDAAQRLVVQIERDSPLSFLAPLDDGAIAGLLDHLVTQSQHWLPALSKAFFGMCTGSAASAVDLASARDAFIRFSNVGRGGTPRGFERDMMARFDVLEHRLHSQTCIVQCHHEAEEHAARLGLPPIEWPVEWPTSVDVDGAVRNRWLDALLGKRGNARSNARGQGKDAR